MCNSINTVHHITVLFGNPSVGCVKYHWLGIATGTDGTKACIFKITNMKLQIFILDDSDQPLIDRSFFIADGNSPFRDLQDMVDDAVKYVKDRKDEADEEVKVEAQRLVKQDKAQS